MKNYFWIFIVTLLEYSTICLNGYSLSKNDSIILSGNSFRCSIIVFFSWVSGTLVVILKGIFSEILPRNYSEIPPKISYQSSSVKSIRKFLNSVFQDFHQWLFQEFLQQLFEEYLKEFFPMFLRESSLKLLQKFFYESYMIFGRSTGFLPEVPLRNLQKVAL